MENYLVGWKSFGIISLSVHIVAVDYLHPTVEDTFDHDEFALYELISAHRASLGLPTVPLSASLTLVAGHKVIDALYNTGTYLVGASGENAAHGWSDRPYDDRNLATYYVVWDAPQFLGTAYPADGFKIGVGYTGPNTLTLTITPEAASIAAWISLQRGSPPLSCRESIHTSCPSSARA
jgi:hypothetical protein